MSPLLELFIYAALFLFVWVYSLLFHELCHIIGTGSLHGTITVNGLSMNATPANLWAGGIFSGIVFMIAGAFIWILGYHAPGYLFLICGVVNLAYGLFEGMFLPVWGNNQEYKIGRYSIYIGVTALMVFLWVVFLR